MANILNQFILISCVFVIKSKAFIYEAPSNCYNPNGRPGLCVSIYECRSLINALNTYQTSAFDFARKSECRLPNAQGRRPFVCCTSDTSFTKRNQRIIFPEDDVDDQTRLPNTTTARTPKLNNQTSNNSMFPKPPECGPITIGNKIYGGEETELGEFPWLANLEYKKPHKELVSVCAGNIINQRYILTAAHCAQGQIEIEAGQLTSVRVGDHNTKTSVDCNESRCLDVFQRLGVAKVIVHNEYSSSTGYYNHNDIALIRTDRDMQYSFSVAPICLPDVARERSHLRTGMKLFVAGWGHTGTSKYSAEKRKVELPYVENEACPFRLTPEQLCAGGEYQKDSCSGDSGGGLVHLAGDAWILEGIVSYGRGCGLERPGVYTRVNSYISWIHANVKP